MGQYLKIKDLEVLHKSVSLRSLPKATGPSSLNFKNTTPGSAAQLFQSRDALRNKKWVDPTHPLAANFSPSSLKTLPSFTSSTLSVKAAPKAITILPDPFIDRASYSRYRVRNKERTSAQGRLNISIQFAVHTREGGLKITKPARDKIKRRIKNYVSLIVTRGIAVQSMDGKAYIEVGTNAPMGKDILLQGWTYLFYPKYELYIMPWTEMIPLLGNALKSIHKQALALESTWRGKYGEERMRGHDESSYTNEEIYQSGQYPPRAIQKKKEEPFYLKQQLDLPISPTVFLEEQNNTNSGSHISFEHLMIPNEDPESSAPEVVKGASSPIPKIFFPVNIGLGQIGRSTKKRLYRMQPIFTVRQRSRLGHWRRRLSRSQPSATQRR